MRKLKLWWRRFVCLVIRHKWMDISLHPPRQMCQRCGARRQLMVRS